MSEWKPVVGFEGRYKVSTEGEIASMLTNRILRPAKNSRGYPCVCLFDGQSPKKPVSFLVHRLVMAAFVGPCPDGKQVNHVNGIKTDNRLANLEYVTQTDNQRHAEYHGLAPKRYRGRANKNAKLTVRDVQMIRKFAELGMPPAALGRAYWVDPTTIEDIRDRKAWSHVPEESA